jgi:sarcosine oxidase
MDYEVIVVGLGAMGSAAAYHLARSRKRVLGLDRFRPPHDQGSSHGRTRIIREAYFEHTLYVPLVRRAYELWAELEQASGRQLLLQTGGLMIGPPGGVLVTGAKRSAEDHKLAHELLSAAELRRRFPVFAPPDDFAAIWEPRAGILFPELAIQAHLELAERAGATLRYDEPILNWELDGQGVRVSTASNQYRAQHLLLSAGAWMSDLLADLLLPLRVERQVMCWFESRGNGSELASSRRLLQTPIFIWEHAPRRFFYGFPDLGDGVKAAIHHEGEITRPELLRRDAQPEDIEAVKGLLARYLPQAAGPLRSAVVCMYTNTPDEHFILGHHPTCPQVLIASPCSGHGFKFSPVIGELASMMLEGRSPSFDLSLFAPERFAGTQASEVKVSEAQVKGEP